MRYAYSNYGTSMRGVEPGWKLNEGEVVFDHEATEKELAAAFPGRAEAMIPSYQQLRAAAYPPIADYIDGIVKGDDKQVRAYINACLAVKERFPKSAPPNNSL